MKRLINVRISLLMVVALVLGIYACYEWLFGDFYFGLAVALLLTIVIVFCAVKRHGAWKFALVMLICVLLGFGITRLNYYAMQKREVNGETVTITGRVCDYNRNSNEISYTFYLEDCVNSESGEKYRGRIELYGSHDLTTGDVVTVTGALHSTYPIKGEVETFFLRHSINYELQDVEILSREAGALKLDEKIRKYFFDVTQDYMPSNGGVMYALLTGDRGAMDETTSWSFTRAGIAHLLAVSGLHVGFIVAIVGFGLSKLRLHPLIECSILLVPLTLYAYICGFAPSIVRAIIMVVCSYVARACFGRYDLLTSLGWAGLLILLVKPFYIFDVGFQLSFLSVYGIATLYAPLNRYLTRKNVNKHLRRFVDAFAISASCTLATFFSVAISYGQVPVLGVFLNVVAIPLVSVVFVLGLFGLIPWVFHYLLTASDAILELVVRSANRVAQFDFSAVTLTALSITVLIVVLLLFAIGGYVNLNRLGKRIFYPICVFFLVLSIVLAFVPKQTHSEAYVSFGYQDAVVAVVSDEGEGALVGDFDDYGAVYSAVEYLGKYKLKSCTLYVARYADANERAMDLVIDKLSVTSVYVLTTQGNANVTKKFEERGIAVHYQYPNSTKGNSITVQSIFDGLLVATKVSVDEINLCLVYDDAHLSSVLDAQLGVDAYILPTASANYPPTATLTFTRYQSAQDYNYGANKYGNFTIKQKGDKILLSFR